MKTETTKVVNSLKIWAIPRSEYYISEHPEELPFEYEISSDDPYQDGAVMVHEAEVTMFVPEGIDLLEKAVETLKTKIKETKDEAANRVEILQKQINNLLLLEYKPNGDL